MNLKNSNSQFQFLLTGFRGDCGYQVQRWLEKNKYTFDYVGNSLPSEVTPCILLHMAAKHPSDCVEDILHSNVSYLEEVVNATKRVCAKVVFFSSTSVYYQKDGECLSSSDGCKVNKKLYGVSKLFGEAYFESAFTNCLSLRLPAILELKNSRNLMSRLFDKIMAGNDVVLKNGHDKFNSLISVNEIMSYVINHPLDCGHAVTDLKSESSLSLYDICSIIKNTTKSKSKIMLDEDNKLISYRPDNHRCINTVNSSPKYQIEIEQWCLARMSYLKKNI